MPTNDNDLRARLMEALQGIARHQAWIESHDRDCARRYGELKDANNDLKATMIRSGSETRENIRGIYRLLWAVVGFIVPALLYIIGYFVSASPLFHH